MSLTAHAGPVISYGQTAQIAGGPTPDYNPALGPSMWFASSGLIDPRFNYQPGGRTVDGVTGWLLGTSAVLDAAPSVNSATNIVTTAIPVAGTPMTLNAATAAGITVGITVQNSATGALSTGNIGLDVATSATNGNYGKILFGSYGTIKIWDPANAVARNVIIVSTADESAGTFTIRGFDIYNFPMTETLTGANNGTVTGKKAWKYITSITPAGTFSGTAVTIGTGLIFGFPLRVDNVGQQFQVFNGILTTTISTFVAPVTTTATATSGDVRGTFTLAAPATSKGLILYCHPSVSNLPAAGTGAVSSSGLVGVTQF